MTSYPYPPSQMTEFDFQNTDHEYYMGRHATTEVKRVAALMIVVPLVLVIFSPVLAAALPLAAVFLASGVVSVTVAKAMEWLSKTVIGGHHTRADLSQPNQRVDRKAGRFFDMVYDDRYVTGYESLDKTLSLLIHVVKESFINSVGGVYGKALRWIYKYVKGEHPTGADTLERATRKLGTKVREMRDQDGYGGGAKQELVKAAAGASLVFLSALTFTGTVITLAMAAPVFVLFSPVLVPALITIFLLAIGFLSSAMFGVAGVDVLTWLYKYVSRGGHPVGGELLGRVVQKPGLKDQAPIGGETSDVDFYKLMKAGTSTTVGISLLILSGLTFIGTVIGLMLVTPLLVIFSPVLVPALVTVFLLLTGFLTSGVFGVAGTLVLAWMYKYATSGPSTYSEKLINLETRGTSEQTIRGDHMATEDGLKLMQSVVALLAASPLLLILGPLLVPMMIGILMLAILCLASGAFSATATRMFEWAYNFFLDGGRRRSRTDSMDRRTLVSLDRGKGDEQKSKGGAALGWSSGL